MDRATAPVARSARILPSAPPHRHPLRPRDQLRLRDLLGWRHQSLDRRQYASMRSSPVKITGQSGSRIEISGSALSIALQMMRSTPVGWLVAATPWLPHSQSGGLCLHLQLPVGVKEIRYGIALADHLAAKIDALAGPSAGEAGPHRVTMSILSALIARDLSRCIVSDCDLKPCLGLPAPGPSCTVGIDTSLVALKRVDALETEALPGDDDGVAGNDPRWAFD
jgi:hypothetical protein